MTNEQGQTPSNTFQQMLQNRGFLACLLLLIAVTGSFKAISARTGSISGPKQAVPLRKPLKHMDTAKLAPYELLRQTDIKAEILEGLGTDQYIQWTLQDNAILDRFAPEAFVNLFITYYTGTPSQVVHVPEQCYSGGGYSILNEEIVQVPIPELQQTIAVKVLTFDRPAFLNRDSRVVMYMFHANGRFAPDGKIVTTIINNPHDRHGYFSKVEVSFGTAEATPSLEQSIEAGKKMFQKLIPILVREHWPDWKEVERKDSDAPRTAATHRPASAISKS